MAGQQNRRSRRRGKQQHTFLSSYLNWPTAIVIGLFAIAAGYLTLWPKFQSYQAGQALYRQILPSSDIKSSSFTFIKGKVTDSIRVAAVSRIDTTHSWDMTFALENIIAGPQKELVLYRANLESSELSFDAVIDTKLHFLDGTYQALMSWYFPDIAFEDQSPLTITGYGKALGSSSRAQFEHIMNHFLGQQKPAEMVTEDNFEQRYLIHPEDRKRILLAIEKGKTIPYSPPPKLLPEPERG